MMMCDFRSLPTAQSSDSPRSRCGVTPGAGGTHSLPRDGKSAMDMLLHHARMIEWPRQNVPGWFLRVYPAADVMDEAIKIAQGTADASVGCHADHDCVNQAYDDAEPGSIYERAATSMPVSARLR
jgi:enoyl-CoA hydratase